MAEIHVRLAHTTINLYVHVHIPMHMFKYPFTHHEEVEVEVRVHMDHINSAYMQTWDAEGRDMYLLYILLDSVRKEGLDDRLQHLQSTVWFYVRRSKRTECTVRFYYKLRIDLQENVSLDSSGDISRHGARRWGGAFGKIRDE